MYQVEKNRIEQLFKTSPFTVNQLQVLDDQPVTLQEKVTHIYNVADLMENSAKEMKLSEHQMLMAFTTGLFHDIACVMDIALTGKQYGPQHGARGALIATGILSTHYDKFGVDEITCIANAIENHDLATPAEFSGFTEVLSSLLRDCDKVDCYRRLLEEPFENTFQRPLQFDAPIRDDWAKRCLAGEPMKYAEMQNFNEEALLYIGWFFQLKNASCKKTAFPTFEKFVQRIIESTQNEEVIKCAMQALQKGEAECPQSTVKIPD